MTTMLKQWALIVALLVLATPAAAQKSALDGFLSDADLKRDRQARREWLNLFHVQARDYLAADSKEKRYDSDWYAKTCAKAALRRDPNGA